MTRSATPPSPSKATDSTPTDSAATDSTAADSTATDSTATDSPATDSPAIASGAILTALVLTLAAALLLLLGVSLTEAVLFLPRLATTYLLRNVTVGAISLGLAGGVLGSFAVLRRQSLLGDAVSHSALPGIYLLFMLWSVAGLASAVVGGVELPAARSLSVVLAGAMVTGLAATGLILVASRQTRLHEDAALALTLSAFFGAGVVLRSWLQGHPGSFGNRAGLEAFLFGSIATMTRSDVIVMSSLAVAAVLTTAVLWKEFKLLAFDPEYLTAVGYPAGRLDALLTLLIVASVIVGLQMVGVVLMSAMLIAPAVAARQWTDRLSAMVLLATLVGAAGGVVGIVASTLAQGISTGPLIAVYVTAVAIGSVILAPNRGVLWQAVRTRRQRSGFAADTLLLHLHEQSALGRAASEDSLRRQLQWPERKFSTALHRLRAAGWATTPDGTAATTAMIPPTGTGTPTDPPSAARTATIGNVTVTDAGGATGRVTGTDAGEATGSNVTVTDAGEARVKRLLSDLGSGTRALDESEPAA